MAYHNLSLTGAQLDAKLGRIDDSIQTIASASGATELDYADASVQEVTNGNTFTLTATDIELRDPS